MKTDPTDQNTAHHLFKTGDADAPDCIKDRNGEVVLGLCRTCRRGEVELDAPCGTDAADSGAIDGRPCKCGGCGYKNEDGWEKNFNDDWPCPKCGHTDHDGYW